MKANNTIHINGKTYDARTGELLVEKATPKKTAATHTPKPNSSQREHKVDPAKKPNAAKRHGNGFVDGIARHPKAAPVTHATKKTTRPKQPTSPHISKRTPLKARLKPKHSQILHRSAVAKPLLQSPATAVVKTVERKTSQPKMQRIERALATPRSNAIHKFNHHTSAAADHRVAKKHASNEGAGLSITNIVHAAEKARKPKVNHKAHHELIAKTLAEANAHSASSHKKTKHTRSINKMHIFAGGAAAVVLAAYVTYLNVPSISMKVASSRAGFAASLPRTPSGYSLRGPIAHTPGQVVINFSSNTDERRFSIAQQPTTWDSAALKENYVSRATDDEPITYQDRGLTIYIYNNGQAAWVNGGKFYTIKAENAQLDTKQILDIATSM